MLNDVGLVAYKEPFTCLLTQGMVCKVTVSCPEHGFLFPSEVDTENDNRVCGKCGREAVVGRVEKMSKSKKNVIDPNTLLEKYGADTTRLFCLFAAPPERDLEWSEQGVEGGFRFLNRVWRMAVEFMPDIRGVRPYSGPATALAGNLKDLYQKTHETIKKVTRDIEDRFHFNTAISAVMELVNTMQAVDEAGVDDAGRQTMRFGLETAVLLLSPIVPHFCDGLWEALGHDQSVLLNPWPVFDEAATVKDEVEVVVQVNGKLRSRFAAALDADPAVLKERALADERIVAFIGEKPVKKVITVKNKLVNIVI